MYLILKYLYLNINVFLKNKKRTKLMNIDLVTKKNIYSLHISYISKI